MSHNMTPEPTMKQNQQELMQFYNLSKHLNAATHYAGILDAVTATFGVQPFHISLAICERSDDGLMAQASHAAILPAFQNAAQALDEYLGTFEAYFLHHDTFVMERALGDTILNNRHVESELIMPLVRQDHVVGVIVFWSETAHQFSIQDWKRLAELVAQAVPVVERVQQQQAQAREIMRLREQDFARLNYLEEVAHDLRASVNSVLHLSKYIAGGALGKTNERQTSALEKMVENGRRLLQRINNLIDVNNISTRSLPLYYETDVDMQREIELAALIAQEHVSGRPVNVVCDVPADLPLITADRIRVRQILNTLITNACAVTEIGAVIITARQRDTGLLITVEDTGPGVDEADAPLIFDAFRARATDPKPDSHMGVGLAVAKGLVEHHGGQMWLENMPGVGALFCVLLPLAPAGASGNEADTL